ncbi:MAG: hypothetical protein AAF493_17065 [Pseudomonadota bacterium]
MWKHSPVIILLIAGVGFGVVQMDREKNKNVASENAIASMESVCAKSQSPKSCRRNVERHHETCFRSTFRPGSTPGGRGASGRASSQAIATHAHIDLPSYQLCVAMGPEGWREHKRRKQAEVAQYMN